MFVGGTIVYELAVDGDTIGKHYPRACGIAVARGSLGNRTQMDHSVELAAVQPAHQVGGRHEVGQLALLEVAPLVVLAEQVIDNNIGSARLIETGDDIRPDKSGAAGD